MDPIYAQVTEAFSGCRDGQFQPTDFAPGDVLEGDIAAAAIQLGKGESISADAFAAAQTAALSPAPAEDGAPSLAAALATVAELRNKLDLAHEEITALKAENDQLKSAAKAKSAKPAEAPAS